MMAFFFQFCIYVWMFALLVCLFFLHVPIFFLLVVRWRSTLCFYRNLKCNMIYN